MTRVLSAVLAAAPLLFSLEAAAVTVAEWDIANANAGVSSSVGVAVEDPHVTAAPLSAHGNLAPAFFVQSTFVYRNWTSAPVPDPAKYYEFTITPDLGYSVDYESLLLAVASGSGGPNGNPTGFFQIRASLDGFTTPGAVVVTQTFPKNAQWQPFAIDLSSLGTTSSPVTFRFTMYQVGDGAYSGLGVNPIQGPNGRNLTVTGTVIEGQAPAGCVPSATTLCIDDQPGDRRFEARVTFETTQGSMPSGPGRAISLASLGIPSGGVFWFTNSTNPEMLLKVLNGCAFNNHYWVFYAAGTNFALLTEVVDTVTGASWVRTNADRTQAPPFGDILAFPCAGQPVVANAAPGGELEAWNDGPRALARLDLDPREACTPNPATLCVDDQPGDRRFEATVFFSTTQGNQPTGFGTAIPLSSVGVPSGGIFWFTNPENPEMLLKVLNGCAFNGHYWVFYAAGTNFALEVEVTDTVTGSTWLSLNPDRRQAPPIGDIVAFPCGAP